MGLVITGVDATLVELELWKRVAAGEETQFARRRSTECKAVTEWASSAAVATGVIRASGWRLSPAADRAAAAALVTAAQLRAGWCHGAALRQQSSPHSAGTAPGCGLTEGVSCCIEPAVAAREDAIRYTL